MMNDSAGSALASLAAEGYEHEPDGLFTSLHYYCQFIMKFFTLTVV